jgi:chromate transport protein ChrA
MHRIIVEEKRWVSEERFLHALNYCMLLPGPEAQQLATYIGWLMHRTLGGLLAGGLFILPGIICIMVLSYVYALWGRVPAVTALFFGLKAAVLAIVIEAVIRIVTCTKKPSLKARHRVYWHFLLRGSVPVYHPRCCTSWAYWRRSYHSAHTSIGRECLRPNAAKPPR